MASSTKHPMIYWAQRSDKLLLTVEVDDMNVSMLKIEGNKFHIQGSNKEGTKYDAELELFDELKGSDIRRIPTARHVELIIPKEKEEWWPRLLKDTKKVCLDFSNPCIKFLQLYFVKRFFYVLPFG